MGETLQLLAEAGFPDARFLARGMEGSVYVLTEGTIGKIPHVVAPAGAEGDTLAELLGGVQLAFALPSPLGHVELGDGRVMHVERRLPGRPLDEFVAAAAGELDVRVVGAVVEVLAALRGLRVNAVDRVILDGERYMADVDGWADALVDLGRRRFARFGSQLVARDPVVPRTASDLLSFVASRRRMAPGLIHGDVCGANVLVDDDCRPTAVIDWGFFSVLAEPALDAAIASAVLDMYGPRAAQVDRVLTDALVERLGVERDVLLAYKGFYALVTSNVYSPDGTDGHFGWCSAMLARQDVRDAAASLAERSGTRVQIT